MENIFCISNLQCRN